MPKNIHILALETSCDETSTAVLRASLFAEQPNFTLLSNITHSQIKLHAKFGGVVPEIAARSHLEQVKLITETALQTAKLDLKNIDYLAVTAGPGLIVSLLVGVEFMKGLALACGKPILAVNHMEGHLYSAFADRDSSGNIKEEKKIEFPVVSLVVSGGHTMLVLITSLHKYRVLGSTVDDAAGEAFDKVAKILGLPYPGGPAISKIAAKYRKKIALGCVPKINFPKPLLHSNNFDFSFSGLKTAVRYYVEKLPPEVVKIQKAEIAWAFEEAVVEVLTKKTIQAAQAFKAKTISLTGGVSANIKLRQELEKYSTQLGIKFFAPPFELCTDNAGMIAIAAYFQLKSGIKLKKPERVNADSNWEIW